jgi:hypothetical protein
MNDTLLEEIILAFQAQKLQPIRRFFFLHDDSGDFACPLVALAAHRGLVSTSDPGIEHDGGTNSALEAAAKAFGEDWTVGFLDGFDGQEPAKQDHPDYVAGHALGLEAARQLAPRDPAA